MSTLPSAALAAHERDELADGPAQEHAASGITTRPTPSRPKPSRDRCGPRVDVGEQEAANTGVSIGLRLNMIRQPRS